MKNLKDYLPGKRRKKTSTKLPESPLYSPETLDALENAEKLITEARRKILEASYDVNSSPERESSNGSHGNNKTNDEDAMYIRDIVATRFNEANESGRIFTRPTARRPIVQLYRPEVHQRRFRPIVAKSDEIPGENSTASQRLGTKNKEVKIPSEDLAEKSRVSSLPEHPNPIDVVPTSISRESETPRNSEEFKKSRKQDDHTTLASFRVQEGPHVDIRNELTMTRVEKIDISPRPRCSLPVQCNIRTYEFRHESHVDEIAERDVDEVSRDTQEVDEKSRDLENTRTAVASNPRGSSSDLVENKSGRSNQPERREGHEDTRSIAYREAQTTNEKRDNRGESFIDFMQRAGNDEDKLPNDHFPGNIFSNALDARDKVDIFDRAVRQFFHDSRIANQAGNKRAPEVEIVDGKLATYRCSDFDKSHSSTENEYLDDVKYHENDWDPEEINLEPPNFRELDDVLRKIDGTINKVLSGTRNLGSLMSDYSIVEKISDRSRIQPINGGVSCLIDLERFYAVPTRDISGNSENKETEGKIGKQVSSKGDNGKIKDSIDSEDSAMSDESLTGLSMLSHCEDSKKYSPLKIIPGKSVDSRPRFSTPLSNDFKIGKSSGNNAPGTSNEFANFFNGIRRKIINTEEGSSRNRDFEKIEKINDDKITHQEVILPVTMRNDLEVEKKIVLGEIERKCNFASLFNRDRKGRQEDETVTLPTRSTREKQNSATGSLIQDSAIGRETEDYEKSSIGTRLIDEYATRKDSSKSERSGVVKNTETTENQSTPSKNMEFTRTQTLIEKKITIERKSVEKDGISEKSTISPRSEKIVPPVEGTTKIDSAEKKDAKNNSLDENERKSKNMATNSPGSSPRDRTSLDISTAYSDDFEELTGSAGKSETKEKTPSPKNLPVKLISNELEVGINDETKNNESEVDKASKSLTSVQSKSREEIDYLKKSISTSVITSDDRNESTKIDDDGNKLGNPVIEDTVSGEKSIGKKEANLSEIEEKSSKESPLSSITMSGEKSIGKKEANLPEIEEKSNKESPRSSIKSLKMSRTSSLAEETHRDELKFPKTSPLDTNLISRPCLVCEGIIGPCNCKDCKTCLKTRDNFNKSKDPIESGIPEQIVETLESGSFEKITISLDLKNDGNSKDLECPEAKNELTGSRMEFSKISLIPETKKSSKASKFEEILKFQSSSLIHSTPKKIIKDSMYTSEKLDFTDPDPIPSDNHHASLAMDTCTENYSEGELYLPSSCSYSLGEIRISELGTCATSGPGLESSLRNADGVRIFHTKSFVNMESSDNTINALNSLGEVQETDVESTGSSRGMSSDGQNQLGKRYTIR